MPGSVRLCGYAIVSADGMIAAADGSMPPALRVESDQLFYHTSLAAARLIVHGRNSNEGGAHAEARSRVIATRRVAALETCRPYPPVMLWNPAGMPFRDVLQALAIDDGIVAIVGGTDVFELFLGIGYDAFYLSRVLAARLPGGRPVFGAVPARAPEEVLTAAGLRLRDERLLEPGVTLTAWERPPDP
jgi:dihydrofolate reductase